MKILVVVDMQNDFIDGSLGTPEAQKIIPNVIAKIKSYHPESIFVTKDMHKEDYLSTLEGKNLPVEHCILWTEGFSINSQVLKELSHVLFTHFFNKPTFGSVELANWIKNWIKNFVPEGEPVEIELIGLCTGICVLSNAILLKAFMPEVEISVDAACCACVTPQSHDTALAAMKLCQIKIENEGKEPWR